MLLIWEVLICFIKSGSPPTGVVFIPVSQVKDGLSSSLLKVVVVAKTISSLAQIRDFVLVAPYC